MLWIDRVPSTRCQATKTTARTTAKNDGRGHVGDAELDVEDVGRHRPDDGHHQHGHQ